MADLFFRAAFWRVGYEVEAPWQNFHSIQTEETSKEPLAYGRPCARRRMPPPAFYGPITSPLNFQTTHEFGGLNSSLNPHPNLQSTRPVTHIKSPDQIHHHTSDRSAFHQLPCKISPHTVLAPASLQTTRPAQQRTKQSRPHQSGRSHRPIFPLLHNSSPHNFCLLHVNRTHLRPIDTTLQNIPGVMDLKGKAWASAGPDKGGVAGRFYC